MPKLIFSLMLIVFTSSISIGGGSSTVGGGSKPLSSAICLKINGVYEALNGQAGEEGYCSFDSSIISSWSLTLYFKNETQRAITLFLKPEIKISNAKLTEPLNPETFCSQNNGQIQFFKNSLGHVYQICRFDDDSSIEAQTFFFGKDHRNNRRFTQILIELK
jgi:hypothetical protein